MRSCSGGRCAWLLWGGRGGCCRGVCMVAVGGMHGCCGGGMRGCSGGHAWLLGGHAWLLGGCAWLLWGGMHGCSGGCVVAPGEGMRGFFSFFRYNEIWSMSGRYASYWNAFLLLFPFTKFIGEIMRKHHKPMDYCHLVKIIHISGNKSKK